MFKSGAKRIGTFLVCFFLSIPANAGVKQQCTEELIPSACNTMGQKEETKLASAIGLLLCRTTDLPCTSKSYNPYADAAAAKYSSWGDIVMRPVNQVMENPVYYYNTGCFTKTWYEPEEEQKRLKNCEMTFNFATSTEQYYSTTLGCMSGAPGISSRTTAVSAWKEICENSGTYTSNICTAFKVNEQGVLLVKSGNEYKPFACKGYRGTVWLPDGRKWSIDQIY